MRQKGFAIILVLATLVLLALLSLTYIKLALIDRNIARNYMDNKRAKLIAQSGVDYAIAKMEEYFLNKSFFNTDKINTMTYKNPAEPSFKQGSWVIDGQSVGYSGALTGGTYGRSTDAYILNVKDANSMININDGVENERVSDNIKRIINSLADVILGAASPTSPDKIGNALINERLGIGYTSKQEILAKLTKIYGETNGKTYFNQLKSYLTTHAWQDNNVANPVPLSDAPAVLDTYPVKYNQNINVYRYGRGKNATSGSVIGLIGTTDYSKLLFCDGSASLPAGNSMGHSIYAVDELNPQWIEMVSRSPVNMNMADKKLLITLIKDLKGFFSVERRKAEPFGGYMNDPLSTLYYPKGSAYDIGGTYSTASYSPSNTMGQLGFLYVTLPFSYDPTPAIDSLTEKVTEHIVACREQRSITIDAVTVDYSSSGDLWFSGIFKTWRQFNAFCDNLVRRGVLQDTRNIFYEYNLSNPDSFSAPTIISSVAKAKATQAMADCLKANFNPNLTLDELNPPANIRTLLDKTDLIVNSTEFCFTPMGYFEIESTGLILKPTDATNAVKIAESQVVAVANIYNATRQTSQAHFVHDLFATEPPLNSQTTDNSTTIEIGPEPTSTNALRSIAKENEAVGYITLPTLEFEQTSNLHSHFREDFNAHVHADGNYANLTDYNYSDPTEATSGPYKFTSDYRLCRSYRSGDRASYPKYAPCDLRIDGAYVERHSTVAYSLSSNIITNPGMAAYWIRPWFYPELAGKARSYFSLSVLARDWYYYSSGGKVWKVWAERPRVFAHWFIAQRADAGSFIYDTGSGGFYRPISFVFGLSTVSPKGVISELFNEWPSDGGGVGVGTASLTSKMKAGQWMHVALYWKLNSMVASSGDFDIAVNGKAAGVDAVDSHPVPKIPFDAYLKATRLRMGETTRISNPWNTYGTSDVTDDAADDSKRNWTADATVDEFYVASVGKGVTFADFITKSYSAGRYYKPDPSKKESYFTSERLQLFTAKLLPSRSTVPDPVAGSAAGATFQERIRIIGLSWTWYPEETDEDPLSLTFKKPIMKNYTDFDAPTKLVPSVTIRFNLNGSDLAKLYSEDDLSLENNIVITKNDSLKYKAYLDAGISATKGPNDVLNAVLLYSPIFDDVTIYYTDGIKFLSYSYSD